jgi:hypothetical protein
MRSLGYSPEPGVADLIDNSVYAMLSRVQQGHKPVGHGLCSENARLGTTLHEP